MRLIKMKATFKKLILTIISILLSQIITYSQNAEYEPLANENAHWKIGWYHYENPPWAPFQMFQYVIQGDSTFNSFQYKKLYYRDLDDENPDLILSEELFGLIREDTLNQKVYAINFYDVEFSDCPTNNEYLLYDFDLAVGDTIDICLNWMSIPWVINEIIYENLFGKERKLYVYIPGLHLIEGVGSSYGLLEWGSILKKSDPFSKGGYFELFDYCIGSDEECGYLWVGLDDLKNPYGFEIFPNPMIGTNLCLQSNAPINEPVKIVLYNMLGSNVFETEFKIFSDNRTIELPEIMMKAKSSFLLVIYKNDQPVFKQVIIH